MSTNDRAIAQSPGGNVVTVLVVDDQASFRSALRELVEATAGFRLIGEAESGEAALEAVDRLLPRMVIMDKRMPGMGGVEAARLLAGRHPGIVTLLVSVEAPNPEFTGPGGAAGFARKQELSSALLREVWREHGQDP
ncbi:MAG TPA: response regulator transcription factor [Solirubrobacteraceae bacterium]|nr:response regulator transcription factor [Solirubrobacteraceae bacterium]